MNDEILATVENLEYIQLESELTTLEKLGHQLMKEYYMEDMQIIQEGHSTSDHDNPITDTGHVPTIHRIADWFSRLINRIRATFMRRHSDRLIERIRNLPANQLSNVFEGIMVDEKWYRENVTRPLGDRDRAEPHPNSGFTGYGNYQFPRKNTLAGVMAFLIPNYYRADLNAVSNFVFQTRGIFDLVKMVRKLRDDFHDSYDEIRHLYSVNQQDGPLKHRRDIGKDDDADWQIAKHKADDYAAPGDTPDVAFQIRNSERGEARNVDSLLNAIEHTNSLIRETFNSIHRSIPQIREIADRLATQDLNRSTDYRHRREAYVHVMTDLGNALMYVAQIQITILQWMRWTLGIEHNPGRAKDV